MKKFLITVVALLTATVFEASAMSTARARSEALFLTDKMAYELDLTDYQYEAVYEINFDYFNSLVGTSDILGIYWTRRANELGYVLTSWQYRRFLESEYFYRPVTYRNNVWYFPIYDRYAYNRFYRPAPRVYITYNGSRHYHKAPHNNRHFADNHIGKGPAHNPAHNPGHKPNHKPDVKPNNGHNGHNGNVGKPANGGGNHNANLGGNNRPTKPANGGNHNANVGGNTKPTKPAGGNHNVGNTPTHSKPAGNVNGGGARRASVAAPTRSATSTPRTSSSAARVSGSSAGRR